MGILLTGLSGSLQLRRQRLKQLEDMVGEQTEEELFTQEVLSFLFQLEAFEEVPGAGAISGAFLNVAMMNRVDVAARKIFQERWLRDNGKVDRIEPAEVHARAMVPGFVGALGRLAYSGCYCVGYGAAMPFFAAAAVVGPMNNALISGIRDGAAAAARGAGVASERARTAVASSSTAPAAGHALARLSPDRIQGLGFGCGLP